MSFSVSPVSILKVLVIRWNTKSFFDHHCQNNFYQEENLNQSPYFFSFSISFWFESTSLIKKKHPIVLFRILALSGFHSSSTALALRAAFDIRFARFIFASNLSLENILNSIDAIYLPVSDILSSTSLIFVSYQFS